MTNVNPRLMKRSSLANVCGKSYTDECGVDPGFHIVGGEEAVEGAYPWMVWTLPFRLLYFYI